MNLPSLNRISSERTVLSAFGGYNHNLSISEGENYEELNLTAENYPVLSVREPKGILYHKGETNVDIPGIPTTFYHDASRVPAKVLRLCDSGFKSFTSDVNGIEYEGESVFVGNVIYPALRPLALLPFTGIGLFSEGKYGFKLLHTFTNPIVNNVETEINNDTDFTMVRMGNKVVFKSLKTYYQFPTETEQGVYGQIDNSVSTETVNIATFAFSGTTLAITCEGICSVFHQIGEEVTVRNSELQSTLRNITGTVYSFDSENDTLTITINPVEEHTYYLHRVFAVEHGTTYFVPDIPDGATTYTMCDSKGNDEDYSNVVVSATAPTDTSKKWIDTSSTPHVLRKYSSAQSEWVTVVTTYIKISCTGIGNGFKEGDGVKLSNIDSSLTQIYDALNDKVSIIKKKGDDYIVVIGILDAVAFQTTTLTVSRTMPDMDIMFECNNRLWGCKGNEIYSCKLGDPTNWNVFEGISSDSYALSLGSSEKFTGGCNYNGYPLFFREKEIIKIYGNYPSNYQTQNLICEGVKAGCSESIVNINGYLYYYSPSGVAVYSGSYPTNINSVFGNKIYDNVMSGSIGNILYMVVTDDTGKQFVMSYDTLKGIWHKGDYFDGIQQVFNISNNIIFVVKSGGAEGGTLYKAYKLLSDEEPENSEYISDQVPFLNEKVKWEAQSGQLDGSMVDRKYVQKLLVKYSMSHSSKMRIYISYDNGAFECVFNAPITDLDTYSVPLMLRRCDHYRLKFEGEGPCDIYSITKTIVQRSDRR